ncbi:MAG: hypothetical protein ACLPWS_04130 [Rhodomicrobium sp.]
MIPLQAFGVHGRTALAGLILTLFHRMSVPDGLMFIFMPGHEVFMLQALLMVHVLTLLVVPLVHLFTLATMARVNFMAIMGPIIAFAKDLSAAGPPRSLMPCALLRHRSIAATALAFVRLSFGHTPP